MKAFIRAAARRFLHSWAKRICAAAAITFMRPLELTVFGITLTRRNAGKKDFRLWPVPLSVALRTRWLRLLGRPNVLFLYQSYYHFYYLSHALRKRGWNAVLVNQEPPAGPNAGYYHGEDINIAAADSEAEEVNRRRLFRWAIRNFDLVHVAGDGCLSFFPKYFGKRRRRLAPDMRLWKRCGKKIAYTISGCNSGVTQTDYAVWSAKGRAYSACDRCRWQNEPAVCNDASNAAWGTLVRKHCDLICAEGMPAIGDLACPQTVFDPLTMCLDPDFWRPDLPIPPEHRIDRRRGELLVYHGMGNYNMRTRKDGKNIKGTYAIMAAVDNLAARGYPVRCVFCSGIKNTDVRYVMAQADVVIDQLNLGCYGAQSREGMMLGKPVICYIHKDNGLPGYPMRWKQECPLVSATEETVEEALRRLLDNPALRAEIGRRSRAYALKWHSADTCAAHYEIICDRLYNPKESNGHP